MNKKVKTNELFDCKNPLLKDLFNASKNLEDILKGKKEGNIEENKNAVIDLFQKTSEALKELLASL